MGAASNPDPIDVAVGVRLRIRRKQLGLSQAALAEALGITFQQVQKYERGANRISASTLVRAAEKLETTVGALVGETEDGTADSEAYRLLLISGAPEMLTAFANMADQTIRNAFLALALNASGGGVKAKA